MFTNLLFGKLTLDAISLHTPIIVAANLFMILTFLGVILVITFYKQF